MARSLRFLRRRLETGAIPESMAGLPADPFSPTRSSLRYRRLSPNRFLLYSVGPDGRDDGGRRAPEVLGEPARPGDIVRANLEVSLAT